MPDGKAVVAICHGCGFIALFKPEVVQTVAKADGTKGVFCRWCKGGIMEVTDDIALIPVASSPNVSKPTIWHKPDCGCVWRQGGDGEIIFDITCNTASPLFITNDVDAIKEHIGQ